MKKMFYIVVIALLSMMLFLSSCKFVTETAYTSVAGFAETYVSDVNLTTVFITYTDEKAEEQVADLHFEVTNPSEAKAEIEGPVPVTNSGDDCVKVFVTNDKEGFKLYKITLLSSGYTEGGYIRTYSVVFRYNEEEPQEIEVKVLVF
jgi:outer membrane lipoprotein-sorting protein